MADPADRTMPFPGIDRIYVINLESRPDRRAEMFSELARIGLSADNPAVEMFPAVRPDDPGDFPSIGARGCFMSHLGVLKRARDAGHGAIMILEDDADFTQAFVSRHREVIGKLVGRQWAIAYLGHRIAKPALEALAREAGPDWAVLPPETGVETTHAMLVNGAAVADLIEHLECLLARPAGDPEGGPMHVDGAYSWFRAQRGDLATLIIPDPMVVQRSSKSDIYASGLKERLPFLSVIRRLRNRLGRLR